MDFIRAVSATLLFCCSTYLIFDLFAHGFSWLVLGFCISGYVAAHYLWPKGHSIDSDWLDYIELVVDFPFRAMALAVRSLGRLVRNTDSDIEIDL
jgi:hypothetical protein